MTLFHAAEGFITMNIHQIINSRFGVETVMWLGRMLPPKVGYAVADLAASLISRQRSLSNVRAARANQWVVHDCRATSAELDELVHEMFRNAARCVYDFYHLLEDEAGMMARVKVDPTFEALFQRTLRMEEGTIICLPHMANYDLVGRAMAFRGMRFQAITPAVRFSGYQVQNHLRRQMGMLATPASMEAVRMATERLKARGTVVTGVDRPLPESRHAPCFFGLPARLPTAHVRLALRLNLPLFVIGVSQEKDGRYCIWAHGPMEMQRCADPDEEILLNAERVLKIVEENIRRFPVQWNMTFPVWPQVMADVPR